ncbi:uncharacterized protein LOC141627551 [Silene latifolia]|uniref:uncharacterized protein LOC141627551 n=1 Tax=Silene latifolia TaxID=37657 RepID=UPI003D77F53A
MKNLADSNRSERSFHIGDWIWLKLQPDRQMSVESTSQTNHKLSAKYFGPFQVEASIGKVAYKLKLHPEVQIHRVFHVSQLKIFKGALPNKPHIPHWLKGRSIDQVLIPHAILARRVVKHQNMAKVQYLIQWEGIPEDDSTWEFAEKFKLKYPTFDFST